MPVGYLVSVVLTAVCTLAALAPPLQPDLVARAGFLLGLVVNEVPHLAGVFLLASTVFAFGQGDLVGDPVSVGMVGLAVLTSAGLVVVGLRGVRARESVGQALSEAGIRTGAGGLGADAPIRPWWLWVMLTPFPVRPRVVERIANLHYGEHRRHRLDVYRRRDHQVGGPVLVYLHGGGYFSGGKHREARALLHRLAARGWVCVSATYRLRPEAAFLDHLVDAKRILAWAHAHASEYGGDTSRLVMAGSSAGAHLTALSALTQGDPALTPGFEGANTSIDAAICLYGYYGRYYGRGPDESPPSTPLALDATEAPAFFVAHGDRDSDVPVDGARALTTRLRAHSRRPVVYAELPGGQHVFDLFRSWRFAAVLDGVEAFLHDERAIGPTPMRTQWPRPTH